MRRRKGLRAQMAAWNHMTREIQRAAMPPRDYVTMGRRFKVAACFPDGQDNAANAWMTANPRHGVIAVTAGRILIAHMDDEGQPLARPRP